MARAHAEHILLRHLEMVASEHHYRDPDIQISPVSTEGANFSSFLFKATISNKDKPNLNLFAKVSAVNKKFRDEIPMRVFDVENVFYTQLVKEYRRLEHKHGVPEQNRFKTPEVYAISTELGDETFIMEDLTEEGYALHDRSESVSWEYAVVAFTELAKMHALSMALKRENPEEYKRYTEEFNFQFPGGEGQMMPMIKNMMQRTLEVTREEYREPLRAFIAKVMGDGFEGFIKFYSPGDCVALRHGDYRPSNLMHRVIENGSIDMIPVDYQTLQPGTPVLDLLYFIFLGTDKQFRDRHYDQLLEHYYKELSAALRRLDLDPDETYSEKKFYEDIKENLGYGVLISLMTLALVCVDSTDAPAVDGERDLASFGNLRHSALYADRLDGNLHHFLEWGVL